jgi:hypothetical protein
METEKRIGDFRVNRKVAWSIFSTTPAHPASIQKAAFSGILADFVHSIGVDLRSPPPQPFQAVLKSGHRHRILESQPPVYDRLGPLAALGLIEPPVASDDDLLDLAQKAGLPGADGGEVLLRKPLEQPVEAGARIKLRVLSGLAWSRLVHWR